ncbi:MAG: PfkB family carbohydrate kinase [Anaerolineales bacterium]
MLTFPGITPVDYLLIGHITQDLTPDGPRIGGTAAFSGLTAHAFGQRVGVVTSWAEESGKAALEDLQIANLPCESSSTFENFYTPEGRRQVLHHLAPNLAYYQIPESWRRAPIVHLAPIAGEVPADLVRYFPDAQICLTPQGWMREWDQDGNITPSPWLEASYMLPQANAAVISEEDVSFDLDTIYHMAASVPVLAVTRGDHGADIYYEGKVSNIPAPQVTEVDPTGAGDIFAAAFFTQLAYYGDPVHAAEIAVIVASDSITRTGLHSAPNPDTLYEILRKVQ